MPEGDSIHRLARKLNAKTVGRRIERSDFRVPRLATLDLSGYSVMSVDAYGKHLLSRLAGPDDDRLTIHSALRMDGSWTVVGPGKRLPSKLDDSIRVVLELDDGSTAAGLDLPVLEVLSTDDETSVIGHLGPDLLAETFDMETAVQRLSAVPELASVEALLDQRNVAGIGNLWVVETLYLRGVHPWRPIGEVDIEGALRLVRKMMLYSLNVQPGMVTTGNTRRGETHWVYGRAGRPCRRCHTPVSFREAGSGHYQRETWWCPSCQPA